MAGRIAGGVARWRGPTFGAVLLVFGAWLVLAVPAVAEDALPPEQAGDGEEVDEDGFEEQEWDRALHRFELAEGVDVVGEEQTAEAGADDTLLDVAKRYAVGYEQIRMANPGVDTWLPGEGAEIRIPSRYILPDAPREGVVINLAEMRLYHYPEDENVVEVFPVSIGRMDWSTPLGRTEVTGKIQDPAWYPPESIRKQAEQRGETMPREVPPGPDNPLGRHAILLDISGYLLHGTNRPWGIGMRATHGCIRLHPRDIDYLYDQLAVGTSVKIVNQPFQAGWSADGLLYLQAFPFFEEDEPKRAERVELAVESVARALGDAVHRVDGGQVRAAADEQDGRIYRVSRTNAVPRWGAEE
ncbi:ErfK/YbiS/YcfS/YnhG family protein [Halorhodospira halophila SL1]|uniref:ErfK/YbiS/YcfS/YnhG family protein n=1 Tax=Halorhodospira halophila (strain DSM 244 / SL1) TaxID=349124 RepID=A1WT96_HALHL|nr:ErfK/YbiS/YcfS/YnhG family protein [Halorhodospira halophila SL1]MBK1728566.1 hypothetical protein [Halorhodospira halophila]